MKPETDPIQPEAFDFVRPEIGAVIESVGENNIAAVRSSEIWEELSRPNMIAILEMLAIIQALIIDADNPENIAKGLGSPGSPVIFVSGAISSTHTGSTIKAGIPKDSTRTKTRTPPKFGRQIGRASCRERV